MYNNNRGNGGGYDRPRQSFRAICDQCGRDCEVPFRPTGSKPVLCSNCFETKNGPRQDRRPRVEDRTRVRRFDPAGTPIETREERENRHISLLRDEVAKLSEKIDKLTEFMSVKNEVVEEKRLKFNEEIRGLIAFTASLSLCSLDPKTTRNGSFLDFRRSRNLVK